MKVFKLCITFLVYFTITACSNTEQVNVPSQTNHYYTKDFNHYEFISHHKNSIKKPASSDHELLFSLLNRSIPEDQRMMLAFAERQKNYFSDNVLVGVQIKGDKRENNRMLVTSNYDHAIGKDVNAVMIGNISN